MEEEKKNKDICLIYVQANLALLCFTNTAFFNKPKVCGKPALSKSVSIMFQHFLLTSVIFW